MNSNKRPQLNIRLKSEETRKALTELAVSLNTTVNDLVLGLIEEKLSNPLASDVDSRIDSNTKKFKPWTSTYGESSPDWALLEIKATIQALTKRIASLEAKFKGDSSTDSSVDSRIDSSTDSSVDSRIDSSTDSSVDSRIDSSTDSSVDSSVDNPPNLYTVHSSAISKEKVYQIFCQVEELAFDRILIEAQAFTLVNAAPKTVRNWFKLRQPPRGKYFALYRKILALILEETQTPIVKILR